MILDVFAVLHGRMTNKEVNLRFSLGMKEGIWIVNLCTYLCGLWGLASWYSGRSYPVSELILHISIPMCFFVLVSPGPNAESSRLKNSQS